MSSLLTQQLFRRRMPAGVINDGVPDSIIQVIDEPDSSVSLKRSMSTFQLTLIGVGGTIGTGIFFILSEAVPKAGPAVLVSFILAAVVAGLTVVCYAELASMMPSSGSSYSYTYATMGEMTAFIVGACLILEYGVSAAAVAVGWSQYVNLLLDNTLGFSFPEALSNAPDAGGIVNLPAIIVVLMCLAVLLRGASESATVNSIMVIVKIAVLGVFAAIAFTAFHADHFANFGVQGVHGVSMATGALFFSYIGLDGIATAGDEVKNPRKSIPRALVAALVIVTSVYFLVGLAALGAQRAELFEGQEAGLAIIAQNVVGSTWPGTLIAVGAVISIFSVTLICMYGQTRILYSMGRDGLIPAAFAKVNARRSVPLFNTWVVSIAVAVLAGLLPMEILADLTSIGTLTAFGLVSLGVMILRRTAPDMRRGFKVPGYPITPILSIAACIYVIVNLQAITLISFAIWIGVALLFYFTWSRKHSQLTKLQEEAERIAQGK
ncbi:MAG: amino acid permease [Ancrocorticia sp.]